MKKTDRIFVAGHRGMVGSRILKCLHQNNFSETFTAERDRVDLTDQGQVRKLFHQEKFDVVILAAARVGGILANSEFPADFIYQNLMIETNVIHEAWRSGVRKLLFLGSSCIYPKFADQPIKEKSLLTGLLESTNEPYAVAKIAGIKLCEAYNRQYGTDFRCLMPTNLYGPGDTYDDKNSHVIPALIKRFHDAKAAGDNDVTVWGQGTALREFLHVDDLATASLHAMSVQSEQFLDACGTSHLNVGSGEEISIRDLAHLVKEVTEFSGDVVFDDTKPDGTPRKLVDSTAMTRLGWTASISLRQGLLSTYAVFKNGCHDAVGRSRVRI
jgi:GDP-L-fucose synthase